MDQRVMTGELERDGVGMATHDGGIRCGKLARRLGQARLAGGDAGTFGRKGHFELGFPCNGAQASRHRALEWIGWTVFAWSLALDVG